MGVALGLLLGVKRGSWGAEGAGADTGSRLSGGQALRFFARMMFRSRSMVSSAVTGRLLGKYVRSRAEAGSASSSVEAKARAPQGQQAMLLRARVFASHLGGRSSKLSGVSPRVRRAGVVPVSKADQQALNGSCSRLFLFFTIKAVPPKTCTDLRSSHSMAAAAPQTLTSDSLEVTRSSHLLSLRHPTPSTTKALSASSILLAARAEKKAARIARGSKKGMEFEGGEDLDEEDDGSDGEMGVAEALLGADMDLDAESEDEVVEKVKQKVKAKSALKKSGGKGMGMQVDA